MVIGEYDTLELPTVLVSTQSPELLVVEIPGALKVTWLPIIPYDPMFEDSAWKSAKFLNPKVWFNEPTTSSHVEYGTLDFNEYANLW